MQGDKPKENRRIFSIGIILLILIIAGFGILRFFRTPLIYADAGFRKATNTIDPEALRAWALESIRTKASRRDTAETMPKSIRELYERPPDVFVNESTLNLMWGGGFFHWGFHISDTNHLLPFVSDNHEYPYNFEWRPGIYYTREAGLKLQ